MKQHDDVLPDVHFGNIGVKSIDWRKSPVDADPDDEILEQTPADVIALLGFDPLDEDE